MNGLINISMDYFNIIVIYFMKFNFFLYDFTNLFF